MTAPKADPSKKEQRARTRTSGGLGLLLLKNALVLGSAGLSMFGLYTLFSLIVGG